MPADFGSNSAPVNDDPGTEGLASEDVVRLRAVFGRMSRLLNREVESGGMTRTQLSILASVVGRGPIGLSELAEIEGINPTMLSRIIGKLDSADLIRRSADAADRRVALVEATEHGRQIHHQMRNERALVLSQALAQLTPDDAATVRGALDALESLVEQVAGRGVASARPVARQASGPDKRAEAGPVVVGSRS